MPIFVADHDFVAETDTELTFKAGAEIEVITQSPTGEWWYGELVGSKDAHGNEKRGWFVPAFGHMSVKGSPYDYMSDKEKIKKRHQTALKIFRQEAAFIKVLQEFILGFVEPVMLLDTPFKRALMSNPSLGLSLSLLRDIHESCRTFLANLKTSKSAQEMATSYHQFAPSLALFAEFTSENAQSLNSLRRFGQALKEFTLSCRMSESTTLEYCLLLPLSHYHNYLKDFQDFVWLTPSRNPELVALEAALKALQVQSKVVDEKVEEEKGMKKLLKLQFEFAGDPPIFKTGRELLMEGGVEKVRRDPGGKGFTRKVYHAHLFSDALIYSVLNNQNAGFKMHKMIPLQGADVSVLAPALHDPLVKGETWRERF